MPTTKPNQLLRSARELRGWSQAYVAEQIGAPYNYYISRWERGEMKAGRYYQQKLCELFGKNAEELGFLPSRESEGMPPAGTEDSTANPSPTDTENLTANPSPADTENLTANP